MTRLCWVLSLLFVASGQTPDADFAQSVKKWTTQPEFSSPLVDHLPVVKGIPTPKDVLGYHIGTPKKLTDTVMIRRYFEALAKASKRLRIVEAGTTDEGRPCWSAVIAEEGTLAELDTYKGYLARLADPREVSTEEAARILERAKPIYHVTGGLHSSETGPPEMLMELAYRLVAEDGALFDSVRKNLIVMITPLLEPDGRDRYVEWYNRYKVHEETEDDRLPGPPYWGKYIYHDNNRDLHYSQVTMRNWLRAYLEWHPPIVHDLHESVPFLYTFSGQAPQNPNLDPILYAELPWFANYEMTKLIGYGMPGVWTHAFVDMWSVGYLGFMASNHNGMLRMYETYGNGGANTMRRKVAGDGDRFGAAQRQWYRPLPAYKEVEWSMRNNTNFMQTGVLSALELAAAHPRVIVENFYKKSLHAIQEGAREAPYGFVIPAGQKDPTRVAWVVNTLRLQGIEVGALRGELQLKEGTFAAGSHVVKRNQPYGRLAKSLLERQTFPDPALRTYDDTGWTMGLTALIDVKEIADKTLLEAPVDAVERMEVKGQVQGGGKYVAVLHNGAHGLIALRYRMKDTVFEAVEAEFRAGDVTVPAGSYVLADSAKLRREVEALGLRAVGLGALPEGKRHLVDLPRLAVFSTWGNTQPVGWVRHALDHYGVGYDLIYKDRVKKGTLRADYDVLLIPSQGGSGKSLVYDLEPAKIPLAYKGMYGESEDITGGMGLAGALEIAKFAEEGGVVITMGTASFFPAEFGLTRQVEARRTSASFYAPGPIVEAKILRPKHPIFYGYENRDVPVRYAAGPVFSVPDTEKDKWTLLQFTGKELSGLLRGAGEIRNKAAILDVPVGKGRMVLFGTNPCYRWQNHGEFPMLFNAILHFND
ncbi:MAG TPA: M14 family zinc carboxypeptidase [Bryobacteraceae bacterium]|nr:M14 family zinc carboxypeptidase [Bryobacteraceae bacterium]